MARIRTIKPELWTDAALGECSPSARLLFVAALNFADDNGNLDRSARQLKAQCFPYDNIDCEELVQELLRVGRWIEYAVNGQKYLHIRGFLKHQKIDRPSSSSRPIPGNSPITLREIDEPSTSPRPVREGKGKDRKGEKEEAREQVRASRSKGSRWPSEAVVPEEWIAEGDSYRAAAKLPEIDLRVEALKFQNYWASKTGSGGTKSDWKRTWLNWCLTDKGGKYGNARQQGKSQTDQLRDIARDGLDDVEF